MMAAIAALFGRLCADRSGVAALLTALGALVLMGCAGLATDIVVWEFDGTRMQSAADQAALAGAVAASNDYDVTTAVDAVAGSYGFVNGQNGATVSVNSNYGNVKEVRVTISQVQPRYFSRFFLSTAPTESKSAVAAPPGAPSSGDMCVMALDESGKLAVGTADFSGNIDVQLNNCDLYNDSEDSDGTELSGGATLAAAHLYLHGSYTISGGANLAVPASDIATWVGYMADPYAGMTIPSYSGCNQTSYKASSTVTASPGVYCGGITVSAGGNLTLNPGTYIIDGGNFTVSGSGKVSGTGVTIILTSSSGSNFGTVQISGGATLTLTAPTADVATCTAISSASTCGIPGIAFWVDKNAPTNQDAFSGGTTQVINGAVYMPSQQIVYSGGTSAADSTSITCSQLIARTINFSGGAYFTHAGCSAANLPVKDPLAPPKLQS